jgi:hypothetical protein
MKGALGVVGVDAHVVRQEDRAAVSVWNRGVGKSEWPAWCAAGRALS